MSALEHPGLAAPVPVNAGAAKGRERAQSEGAGVATADAKRPVLKNVQGLRAFAVLLVVCLHLQLAHNGVDLEREPLFGIFRIFGNAGVDLFFAISGFIMLVTNWEQFGKVGASGRFFLHRVIRIYPAYWLSIVPIALVFFLARDRLMTGHVEGKTDLLASVFLYPQPVQHVLLPVSWTLVFEMTFYVIFAFMLLAHRRYLVPFLALWLCVQLTLWAAFESSPNPYLKYAATALPIEFIFGIVVGLCYVHGRMPHPRKIFAAGAAGAIFVWAAATFGSLQVTNSMGRVLTFGVPFALILYGAVAFEAEGAFIVPMWLVAIGDASYAAYLWHFPVINVLRQGVLRLHPMGRPAEILILTASLAVVFLFSMAVYRYFEKPVTTRLNALARERLRPRKSVALPHVGGVASAGATASDGKQN